MSHGIFKRRFFYEGIYSYNILSFGEISSPARDLCKGIHYRGILSLGGWQGGTCKEQIAQDGKITSNRTTVYRYSSLSLGAIYGPVNGHGHHSGNDKSC